jgi:hypothetical protein
MAAARAEPALASTRTTAPTETALARAATDRAIATMASTTTSQPDADDPRAIGPFSLGDAISSPWYARHSTVARRADDLLRSRAIATVTQVC